ncbi:MAG: hypothetical protein HY894_06855 [Deltaproteobacteria bacterium]|nr:hypothetical protein [Deltaproteobacteria bacterium]
MLKIDARAEVFWTAFKPLSKKERDAIVGLLLRDREFVEDLMDAVIIEERRKEPSSGLDGYLERRRGGLTMGHDARRLR